MTAEQRVQLTNDELVAVTKAVTTLAAMTIKATGGAASCFEVENGGSTATCFTFIDLPEAVALIKQSLDGVARDVSRVLGPDGKPLGSRVVN